MTLLVGIRNLMTRMKGESAELSAREVAKEPPVVETPEPAASLEVDIAEPPVPAPEPAAVEKGIDDLARLLGEIDDRLGAQTVRTERLMQPIEGLPHVVEALEEIKTRFGKMQELLSEQVENSRVGSRAVETSLGGLGDATSHHTESLGLIQQRLDSNSQAIRHTAESYDALTQSMREVLETSCKLQEAISALGEANEEREDELATLINTTQRRVNLLAISCGAVSIVAIGLAVLALVG